MNENKYKEYLKEIDSLMGCKSGSEEEKRLILLAGKCEKYEQSKYNFINTIKYVELWKGWRGFCINGMNFESSKDCDGYFIIVSPEFNPSANYKISSKGLKSLENKLNKIDYKIVR